MAALDYRDFYIKYPQNSNYHSDLIITESFTDLIVNKLEMILFTNKGDVISDPDFGCSLEFYLWQTRVSASTVQDIIRQQISTYIPELDTIGYDINVSMIQGEIRDIMVIDIFLNDQTIQAILK